MDTGETGFSGLMFSLKPYIIKRAQRTAFGMRI
jgi:hypothetical protein